VEKKGTTRSGVDPKLRKRRDLKNLLLQKKISPRKKEGMCTWLIQSHAYNEAWLVDSGASFHMNPHKAWFCEYERYYGGNVFLGDDLTTRIIGQGNVKLRLIDKRIRTLPGVLALEVNSRLLLS
jgi:hypothetical protein